MIALGRTLYYETVLSDGHDLSCNSCHALNGFGALAHEYATALGFTFVAVGLQVVLGSFFVSLLTMRTGEQSRAMVVRFEPDRRHVGV